MKKDKFVALAMAIAVAASAIPTTVFAQQSTALAGTAKDEAKKPFTDFTVRARDVQAGTIAGTIALDAQGSFSLTGLSTQRYLVELLNKNGKVVCTEGPFDLSQQAIKDNVVIDCGNKVPTSLLLVGAAAAAGITAGVVSGGSSTTPPPAASTFSVAPASTASASR